ncbi:acetyl-coenzyme A synthetase, partial [Vibrio parahaemolyticus]|uniref:acetyl-coenzyme A synthetase N-terminal domain-containing protein n=1 Tax=Vibrio parahaemolyticus TaxID=670 RepID=UPI001845CE21
MSTSYPEQPVQTTTIDSVLHEERVFPPPAEFAQSAHIRSLEEYERLYEEALHSPETFWAKQADHLRWFKRWDKVLEWELP